MHVAFNPLYPHCARPRRERSCQPGLLFCRIVVPPCPFNRPFSRSSPARALFFDRLLFRTVARPDKDVLSVPRVYSPAFQIFQASLANICRGPHMVYIFFYQFNVTCIICEDVNVSVLITPQFYRTFKIGIKILEIPTFHLTLMFKVQ